MNDTTLAHLISLGWAARTWMPAAGTFRVEKDGYVVEVRRVRATRPDSDHWNWHIRGTFGKKLVAQRRSILGVFLMEAMQEVQDEIAIHLVHRQ